MEYLQWCIDMNMEPLLAVWSGLSLGGGIVQGSALQPYIADIINELEFLLGDVKTEYGALRAKYGHQEPYKINFIEVGNEDNLSGGCASYPSRFMDIYNAIHKAYPHITIVASTSDPSCLPSTLPSGVYTDTHHYDTPDTFVKRFSEWDNVGRGNGHGVLVGEYASTSNNNGQQTYWSNMQGSCGEAVYIIGMERNSDIVKMASFAPLLEHYDMAQWSVSSVFHLEVGWANRILNVSSRIFLVSTQQLVPSRAAPPSGFNIYSPQTGVTPLSPSRLIQVSVLYIGLPRPKTILHTI